MHTTTSLGLSDALTTLQEVMNAMETILAIEPDNEDEATAITAITPLARMAVVMACEEIMANTSPDMWSDDERTYIEECAYAATNMETDA